MPAQPTELHARIIDLFGSPAIADPTKLYGNLTVTPNANVLVGTNTEATTTHKLQVGGGLVVNSYDSGNYGQIRIVQGNYGIIHRFDGTNYYLLSTASGAQYGNWTTYRPITVNASTGAVALVSDGATLTVNGNTWLSSTSGTYSPTLYLNANGYAPFIRSNNSNSTIEFVNSANTAVNVTIGDTGVVNFPRARPTWAGYTPWDSNNLVNPSYCTSGNLVKFAWSSPIAGQIGVTVDSTYEGIMLVYDGGTIKDMWGTPRIQYHQNDWTSVYGGTQSANWLLGCYGLAGDGKAHLDWNGNWHAVSYATDSDYRLKDGVVPLTEALSTVNQLKPSRFYFKKDQSKTVVDGFIAHEIQAVVPGAVLGDKDAVHTVNNIVLDANGLVVYDYVTKEQFDAGLESGLYTSDLVWKEEATVPKYQSVDYAKITPLLTAAVQELSSKVDAQQSQIFSQQTLIASLQAQIASK